MVCPLTNASSARCVTQPTLKAKTTTTSKLSIRFRQLDEMSLIRPYLRERRKKKTTSGDGSGNKPKVAPDPARQSAFAW